ncbi:MAG TPA: cation:proton antiporter [Bacteroidota bacterium]|nr:cation:proton antiporter [Bacteroidota bacterium]
METAPVIIFVGLLVFLAHWFSGIFSRTRIPDVLMLILVGLLLGPIFRVVLPVDFGAVGPVFVTVALVIILFEGGIGLQPDVLRSSFRGTAALTIVGFVATTVLIGIIVRWTTPLNWLLSLMLGAILGGTSSAVVMPLVRQLQLEERARTILVLESVLTDVLCIVVALGLLEAHTLKAGDFQVGAMIGKIFASFLLAAILGMVGAFGWSILLHRVRTLQYSIFTTPAFVFVLYGVVEMLGYSGAIAALAFGFALGNTELFYIPLIKKYVPGEPIALNETEKVFFAEAVFLIKTFFFVYVGLSIKLDDPWSVYYGFLLALSIFLLRIPVVRVSVQKNIRRTDAGLMAVMVPKGLAPAVLASIPLQRGIEGGEFIQNTTYAVVLFSIVLNSVLIFLVEKTPFSAVYSAFFRSYADASPPKEVPHKTEAAG